MENKKRQSLFIIALLLLCPVLAMAIGTAGKAKLAIEPFNIKAGGEAEMLISMSNSEDDITLVQFDMVLPQGLSVKKIAGEYDIDIAGRTTWKNHSLDANDLGSAIRFLLSSSKNSQITGTSGAIISVKLTASTSFKGGDIKLQNILLVNPDGKTESKPSDYTYTIAIEQKVLVTKITLNATSASLNVGDTKQLTANISPTNATDKSVSWTSSNRSIATVSSTGLVTAKAEGSATITCTAKDGSNVFAQCEIMVKKQNANVIASGVDGNITWELTQDGTLTINGKGEMTDYNETMKRPWENYLTHIKKVFISNGLTNIGTFSFCYCPNLASIVIPNTVTKIGESAFHSCETLSSIALPNSLTHIGESAFWGCESLSSILFPNSLIHIGKSAFWGCLNITSIVIPNTVTKIEDYTFSFCKTLSSIALPNSLTYIGRYAFWGCYRLASLTLPKSITSIGDYAFYDCTGIRIVKSYIESPRILHDKTFQYSAVETLYVPKGTKRLYQSTDGWKNFINIVEMEDGDGIESITTNVESEKPMYDLSGRKVTTPVCGINIIDGKKVIVK